MTTIDDTMLIEAVRGIIEEFKLEIQANMSSQGINASGRTSASLRVVDTESGVALIGGGEDAAPIPTLEIGRGGGSIPYEFVSIISQWTLDKGLSFESEEEREKASRAIAWKIAREGTDRHSNPIDTIYSTLVPEYRTKIIDVVKVAFIKTIKQNLVNG